MIRPVTEQPLESFGEYDVYEQLGAGGMAKVHRAKKRGIAGFQRVVALKRLLEPLAEDEKFIDSFVREARLASYLNHANIIQIYDLGQVEKIYFIAMELVRGRDLRRILKQTAYATGPMPVPIMLYLIRQLCDALEYAHHLRDEHGEPLRLVHRDISPSNLLVAEDGNLKIIDFGIAKAAPSSLRTQSGRLKGKFSYMAPEVIRGHSFEHRSDLFAVGVVAYELLTAKPLFAAKNEYETLRRITKKPVRPPSSRNSRCPPELDEVVLRALAKTPAKRWRSAGAMLAALDQVAKKLSLQATNRDVAEWMTWAFEQPLQARRISGHLDAVSTGSTPGSSPARSSGASTPASSPELPAPEQPIVEVASRPTEPEPLAPPPGPPPAVARLTGLDLANIDMVWSEGGESGGADGHLSRELTTRITNAFASQDAPTVTMADALPLPVELSEDPYESLSEGSDDDSSNGASEAKNMPSSEAGDVDSVGETGAIAKSNASPISPSESARTGGTSLLGYIVLLVLAGVLATLIYLI